MRIVQAFQDHPASVGETYLQHMRSALGFTATMCRAAVCCGIHAFLPFLFQKTGSSAIDDLHRRMVLQRDKRKRPAAGLSTPSGTAPERHNRAAA